MQFIECQCMYNFREPAQLRGQSIAFVMRWSSVRVRQPAFSIFFWICAFYIFFSLKSKNKEKNNDRLCCRNFHLGIKRKGFKLDRPNQIGKTLSFPFSFYLDILIQNIEYSIYFVYDVYTTHFIIHWNPTLQWISFHLAFSSV